MQGRSRIRLGRRAALALALLWPAAVVAQGKAPGQPPTVDAFDGVFRDWMSRHRIARGVLAVGHGERLVLVRGYGGLDPAAPVPIASLSKAITGLCVATLVRAGKLSFSATLGEVLGPFFKRHGEPADARARRITVEHLLVHRSGYSRKATRDPASGPALVDLLRRHGTARPHLDEAVRLALRYKLVREPGAAYEYVNANYLLLGAVIEQAAGEPYEDYCRKAVLRSLGIPGGRLGPVWTALSSYGGWSVTAAEYIALLRGFAPGNAAVLSPGLRRWMTAAEGKRINGDAGVFYSLGIVMRLDGNGPSLWHTGLWTHAQRESASGPLNDSHATLAVRAAGGAAYFAFVAPEPSKAARAELDAALWRVAHAIRAWPAEDLFPKYGVR